MDVTVLADLSDRKYTRYVLEVNEVVREGWTGWNPPVGFRFEVAVIREKTSISVDWRLEDKKSSFLNLKDLQKRLQEKRGREEEPELIGFEIVNEEERER